MLFRNISHILYQPRTSFEEADRTPATPLELVIHTAMLSLIPTICGYIASVHIGWNLGVGEAFTLTVTQALYVATAAFITFNIGVYAMGFGIYWLATTFDVKPTPIHCIELALFSAVPLFLTGFMALYPVLYIDVLVGLAAVAASIYLLYTGVPIFMHIPQEEGFVYSTWVVSLGMVMLVVFLGISVFIFSWLS